MPMCLPRKRARASSSSLLKSLPATNTEPESARSSPVITISRVDLPDPDGPRSATASPRPILRSISRRMWTRAAPPPSDRLTARNAIAEPPRGCPNVSCMSSTKRPAPSPRGRSYGGGETWRHMVRAALCSVALLLGIVIAPAQADVAGKPVKIVALGDSLTAGLGLPASEGFVPRLQAALTAKGIAAEVINAGVSGDTASDALARLDWSVPDDTDAVILEVGANDMLRGLKPQLTR